MAQIRYDNDTDLAPIRKKKVAVIGYGSQGHAHALNLRDSGVEVRVGLPAASKSRRAAGADGVEVVDVGQAAAWCDAVMMLAPDTRQPAIYHECIKPHLSAGKTLMFAHGFNIRFGTIAPPPNVDVSLVAPKSPGHRLREVYTQGGGVPSLLAVHQDSTGQADAVALSYAMALGSTRVGVITTTFAEETETDLFGEQAVLCGGVNELVKAAFGTLVDAGYQPELAYFECMHELKLIVDLMYRGGLNYVRYSVSDTAEYGDYVSGPRVIDDRARAEMKKILEEITDGSFAKKWIAENASGGSEFQRMRSAEREQRVEQVGRRLREMMPFVDPVVARPGD